MTRRKYKTGTRFCIWRWTDTHSEYITRLHLIKTPWFAVCLHWLNKPDPEPYLHDHPVSFLSLILRGGYSEWRNTPNPDKYYPRTHKWYNYIPASDLWAHSIYIVKPRTLTLCFMGPKTRTWGYHTPRGWVDWQTYNQEKYKNETNR